MSFGGSGDDGRLGVCASVTVGALIVALVILQMVLAPKLVDDVCDVGVAAMAFVFGVHCWLGSSNDVDATE